MSILVMEKVIALVRKAMLGTGVMALFMGSQTMIVQPCFAATGTNFTVGIQSMPSDVGAQTAESNAAAQVLYNIYDTLIMREPHSGSFTKKPGLAESWKQVNPLTWEFKLRPNVKFHDGSPLTADDVVFSFMRVINKENPLYSNVIAKFFNNMKEVVAVDPLTVRISTIKPDPLMEIILSDPNTGISSKKYFEKVGFDKSNQLPVATGPYKVKEFLPKDKIVLERFDSYWGKPAPFATVTYKLIPEIAARMTALVNGEADFVVSIPPDQENVLSQQKNITLLGTAWPMFHVLAMNESHPAVQNPKIRQAMDMSIDRDMLVAALWNGKGKAAQSLQFADYGAPMYMPEVKTVEFNPAKAKQLVKESGYKGEVIEVYNQGNYYTYADLAIQAMLEMWREVGINAKLVQIDSYPSDYSGIAARTWSHPLHYPDPMGVMATHWNEFGWPYKRKFFKPTEEWNKQYDIARYSTKVEERKKAYATLLGIMKEQAFSILLYQPYEAFGMKKGISWKIPVAYRPYTLSFRADEIDWKK